LVKRGLTVPVVFAVVPPNAMSRVVDFAVMRLGPTTRERVRAGDNLPEKSGAQEDYQRHGEFEQVPLHRDTSITNMPSLPH